MHRHLLGIESPPADHVPDPLTLGPVLPEGWDGDAWIAAKGDHFFLRAWNKSSSRVAYARAETYETARRLLLDEIADGSQTVEVPLPTSRNG